MPNFNTHWLVAIKCIESSNYLPDDIKDGFEKYCTLTASFKKQLTSAINAIINPEMHKEFVKSSSKKDSGLDGMIKDYNDNITKPENHDPITIFSAYMLGACGPDFWTVTSPKKNPANLEPDTAGTHFDLGHYNRSHQQFLVAIERWRDNEFKTGENKLSEFQMKVEQAYFYGMATHIATDCVVHQLVNVSAGAYHLLKNKNWYDEQCKLLKVPILRIWNAHNKVEHFWDSYIRYRYLGDINAIWPFKEKDPLMTPLDFPTTEKFIADLTADLDVLKAEKTKQSDKIKAKEKLIKSLKEDEVKVKIEKAFIFPRIFCDRVIIKDDDKEKKKTAKKEPIKPFLYDIVVNKKKGAYKEDIIFPAAMTEKESPQMQGPPDVDGNPTFNENKKLAFFADTLNKEIDWRGISFNYLNYCTCPNLDQLLPYYWDDFYHTEALKPFVDSAVKVGKAFINDLSSGITSKSRELSSTDLGNLGKFWNLDTGHGIEVKNRPSHTRYEVITELKFFHISEAIPHKYVDYKESPNYLEKTTVLPTDKIPEVQAFKTETLAFDTYDGHVFDSINKVVEKGAERYLGQIKLKSSKDPASAHCNIDSFFKDTQSTETNPTEVSTKKVNEINVIRSDDIKHRLNLLMTVPIPYHSQQPAAKVQMLNVKEHQPVRNPSYRGELGFYLWNDDKAKLDAKARQDAIKAQKEAKAKQARDEELKSLGISPDDNEAKQETSDGISMETWLQDYSKVITFFTAKTMGSKPGRYKRSGDLCVFESRLLINLEHDIKDTRKISVTDWNNVINFDDHKDKQYSRNYCVGTGRQNVLYPVKRGSFKGMEHFKKLGDVSPTEQVFFSLYLLVKTKEKTGEDTWKYVWFDMMTKEFVPEADLEKIKKIDTLGFVKIVLFYELNNTGAAQVKECYIDGLKVNVA